MGLRRLRDAEAICEQEVENAYHLISDAKDILVRAQHITDEELMVRQHLADHRF